LAQLVFVPVEAANLRWSAIWKIGTSKGGIVIFLGVVLLIIGFITGIAIVWTIGVIVFVVGLVLWLLGAMGHAVGGRRHYY
jgi:Flp pilus assembly protein protease CpaA